MDSGKNKSFFFNKLFNYEYWPFWLFYIPMYFYGIYLAIKSRSPMYFSSTNPGMKYSGVVGESKYKVLSTILDEYVPKTVFIASSTPYSSILNIIRENNISYPLIIKPDVGERGKDVEKLDDENELKQYLLGKSSDLNIQEFIEYELEFGIMYHRIPGDNIGKITSMVQKGFLSVTGDGQQTIRELLLGEIRSANRIEYFERKLDNQMDIVLTKGKKIYPEPIGNHCRGTIFYNANHLINEQLTKVINDIALNVDGYFYGRFDLKVNSVEDLYKGENMKIIELNGVSSEVAHIYDPNYKLIQAYKDVFAHMKYIYQIAIKNHEFGVTYDSLWVFLKDLLSHLKR